MGNDIILLEDSKIIMSKLHCLSLHFASKRGCLSCLTTFINAGTDINRTGIFGGCPIHWTARNGHFECLQLLIQHGADVNRKKDDDGWTPLHLASFNGHLDIVGLLLDNGADQYLCNHHNEMASDVASNGEIKAFIDYYGESAIKCAVED
jgi:ankyrin repeat protein